MGNAIATRWLPGVDDHGTALGIARTVGQGQAGLRHLLANNIEFLTGAVVRYQVPSTAPIAYLNAGEQVIRGPTPPGSVTIDRVEVLGPGGYRSAAQNSNPTALPTKAPYLAPHNRGDFQAWQPQAAQWCLNNP
jgi:hypothetical protein